MAAFSSLTDRLSGAFKNLRSKGKLSQSDIDGTIREIRRALLDADVSVNVVRSFCARVRERASGEDVSESLNPAQQVVSIVNEELTEILGANVDRPLNFAKNGPTVIMLAGLQGAGKTTLAGKLGYWLKDTGHSPLLVACDLQRPNAVTQLQVTGERAGVEVFAPEPGVQSASSDVVSPEEATGDPVQVAKDSVEYAKKKLYDVVIIDTAGRLGLDSVLMQQARDIRDAVNPNEVLFVIDSMIGQDAVTTAKAFDEGVEIRKSVLCGENKIRYLQNDEGSGVYVGFFACQFQPDEGSYKYYRSDQRDGESRGVCRFTDKEIRIQHSGTQLIDQPRDHRRYDTGKLTYAKDRHVCRKKQSGGSLNSFILKRLELGIKIDGKESEKVKY